MLANLAKPLNSLSEFRIEFKLVAFVRQCSSFASKSAYCLAFWYRDHMFAWFVSWKVTHLQCNNTIGNSISADLKLYEKCDLITDWKSERGESEKEQNQTGCGWLVGLLNIFVFLHGRFFKCLEGREAPWVLLSTDRSASSWKSGCQRYLAKTAIRLKFYLVCPQVTVGSNRLPGRSSLGRMSPLKAVD